MRKIGSPKMRTSKSPRYTIMIEPVCWPPDEVDELDDVSEPESELVIDDIVLEIELDSELTELESSRPRPTPS